MLCIHIESKSTTRTTRTPAFWEYHHPHPLPHPKSKQDKVKVTNLNLKNLPKLQILKSTLHAIHLLKLFDKMCKCKMDLASIVEDTERTRFCPQTDRWMDRRTRWNQYTPFQLRWSGGYNKTSRNVCTWHIYWSDISLYTHKFAWLCLQWKFVFICQSNVEKITKITDNLSTGRS